MKTLVIGPRHDHRDAAVNRPWQENNIVNVGKAFSTELASAQTALRALETQINGKDLVNGFEVEYAMGYAKPADWNPLSPKANSLWRGGAGGSTICVDEAHLLVLFCWRHPPSCVNFVDIGKQRRVRLAYCWVIADSGDGGT